MTIYTFPYEERAHPFFSVITRPIIQLQIRSERFGQWIALDDVLVDTGADMSVVPLRLGELLIANVRAGQPTLLGGSVAATTSFNAFIHRVQAQLGDTLFDLPLAVADTNTVPVLFGRYQALDRFTARFVSGTELIIET